jgi:hypothetical protein
MILPRDIMYYYFTIVPQGIAKSGRDRPATSSLEGSTFALLAANHHAERLSSTSLKRDIIFEASNCATVRPCPNGIQTGWDAEMMTAICFRRNGSEVRHPTRLVVQVLCPS